MKKIIVVVLSVCLALGACAGAFAKPHVSTVPTEITSGQAAPVPTEKPEQKSSPVTGINPEKKDEPSAQPMETSEIVTRETPTPVPAPTPTPKEKRLKELREKLADLNARLDQTIKGLGKYKGNLVLLFLEYIGFSARDAFNILIRLGLRVSVKPEDTLNFCSLVLSFAKLTDEILKVEAEIRRLEGS